jgi:Fe2+ or Zn2+ uptake regulation protein
MITNLFRGGKDAMQKYVDVLKRQGLKVTAPRLEIMRYLDTNKVHPTADRIYSDLKKKNPSLSRTTVYNTLETLKRHGVVDILYITPSEMRYDCRCEMHHHFLCRGCGSIFDIDVKCRFLDRMLNDEHMVEEVHGYFKGLCNKCLKKGKGKRTV